MYGGVFEIFNVSEVFAKKNNRIAVSRLFHVSPMIFIAIGAKRNERRAANSIGTPTRSSNHTRNFAHIPEAEKRLMRSHTRNFWREHKVDSKLQVVVLTSTVTWYNYTSV